MCRRNINPELHTALASHLQNVAWLIEFRIRNLAGPTINRLLAAHKLAGFISVNGHLQAGRRVAVEVDLRDKGVICSEESRIEAAVWCQQRNALHYTVVCKDDCLAYLLLRGEGYRPRGSALPRSPMWCSALGQEHHTRRCHLQRRYPSLAEALR
jgi:hypothetical protein